MKPARVCSRFWKDESGASNWITPAKVLEAARLIKSGKIYDIGRVYDSSMPMFGARVFGLRIPGAPTGGPFGKNRLVYHDEFLATEIGQVGTQFDGLGHIGCVVGKDGDMTEVRFYNGFTEAEIANAYGLQKLGVEKIKPLFTRGILVDVAGLKGRMLDKGEEIKVADVQAALQRAGIAEGSIRPGDGVFQHRVLRAAFDLLQRPSGPVLEEFPEEIPGSGVAAPGRSSSPVADRSGDVAFEVTTLRPYYRRRAGPLREAEMRGVPVYVIRNNTVSQIEQSLLAMRAPGAEDDPTTAALREAEEAIAAVAFDGKMAVELAPQNAYIRRLQHELATRHGVDSTTRGREPFRHVTVMASDAARRTRDDAWSEDWRA